MQPCEDPGRRLPRQNGLVKTIAKYSVACVLGLIGGLGAAQSPSQKSSQRNVPATPGEKLFVSNCSGCHGLDARGGDRAPAIGSASDAAEMSDEQLVHTVTNGVAGAGMPPFSTLGSGQIASIVKYLRVLQGRSAAAKLPGSPEAGGSLFFGKAGCSDCHMAEGKGGFIADDLTGYGAGRSTSEIREAITKPQSGEDNKNRQVLILTRAGHEYRGTIRTDDNFSLVLQTMAGQFVMVKKADLKSLQYDSDTIMPKTYGSTLSAYELDDLVSYLMQLQRKSDPSAAKEAAKGHWAEEE